MSDDPQDLAAEVVMDALKERPELFVAMHYLGLMDGSALPTPIVDRIDPQADRVIVVMEQLEPVQRAPRPLHEIVSDTARWQPKRTRTRQESSSAFARWVNGEISYHPSVLGWPDEGRNWPRGE